MTDQIKAEHSRVEIVAAITRARQASVPLILLTTSDPAATQEKIVNGCIVDDAAVTWDIIRGLDSANKAGEQELGRLGNTEVEATKGNQNKALVVCERLSDGTVVFMHNLQRFITGATAKASTIQAVWNLRDEFKTNGRCLILLVPPGVSLPVELRSDVLIFDDPRPDRSRLATIVRGMIAASEDSTTEEVGRQVEFGECRREVPQAVDALLGTSAFQAEQLAAMSIEENGFHMQFMENQAREMMAQIPGLTYETGSETFAEIGGLEGAKDWSQALFNGPWKPAAVVRIEELEKAMGGSSTDGSGTSQDALQVLLSSMEDYGWDGVLAYGAPGSGKSLFAKSMANTFGVKAIKFDINACKGSLVGKSEEQIRQAVDILHTIGGRRVIFVGSCNRLDGIPAELQRRFRSGVWYFDTPSAEQRREIWQIHLQDRFGDADHFDIDAIDEEDLVGSDIRNICEQAWKLGRTLDEARRSVICLKERSPELLQNIRTDAIRKFWDVNTGEIYGGRETTPKKARRGRKVNA